MWRLFAWVICLGFAGVGIWGTFFAPRVQAWYIVYCRERPWYTALMPEAYRSYVFDPGAIWSYRVAGVVSLLLALLAVAVLLSNRRWPVE